MVSCSEYKNRRGSPPPVRTASNVSRDARRRAPSLCIVARECIPETTLVTSDPSADLPILDFLCLWTSERGGGSWFVDAVTDL